MKVVVSHTRQQSTLYNIPQQQKEEISKPSKAIIISEIATAIKEDELAIRTEFRLLPSKSFFSKVNLDLYFRYQLLNSVTLGITQSKLLSDSLEYTQVLDMRGIGAGSYLVRVEMYEPWEPQEKLNLVKKEVAVQYIPVRREDRYVKVPSVRSVAGADLTVLSTSAKNIYQKIERDLKKESISKRDEW